MREAARLELVKFRPSRRWRDRRLGARDRPQARQLGGPGCSAKPPISKQPGRPAMLTGFTREKIARPSKSGKSRLERRYQEPQRATLAFAVRRLAICRVRALDHLNGTYGMLHAGPFLNRSLRCQNDVFRVPTAEAVRCGRYPSCQ
jgi:hypothetical protein